MITIHLILETEADHESLTDLHDGKVQTVGDLHNGATNPKDGLGGLTPEITSRSSAFWRRVNELLEKHKQSYVIVWNGAHSFFLQLTNLNVSGAYNCGPKKSEDLNLSSAIYYNCLLQINEVELYAIRKELEQQYGRMLWKLNLQDVNCTAIIKSANGRLSIDSMVLRDEYRRMTPAKIHDWLSAALIDAPLDDFTKGFMFHLALNSDNNALYITCCDVDGFVRYSKTSDVIGNTDDVDSDADFEEPRVESSRPRLKVRNPPPIRIADLNNGNSVINTGNPPERDAHMDSLWQTFWPKIKEILEERRKSSVIVWSGAHSFFLQLMKLNVSDSTSCTLDDSLSPHLPPVLHYNCTLQIDEMELYAIRRELEPQYGRMLWNLALREVNFTVIIKLANGRLSIESMALREEYRRMTPAKIYDWLSAALMDAPLDDFAEGFMFHLALKSDNNALYITCCDEDGFVRYSSTFAENLDDKKSDLDVEGPRVEASQQNLNLLEVQSPHGRSFNKSRTFKWDFVL
ncbi:unnamed protein product [Schistocephalus solidus]|uniref:DNA-directed DNA polymerase n=1 Tax=Schistocephalus solidus TaxID=70667 RepID=A0A183TAZ1_SCHSO|nr:unnamed protein product [Schistocephalus solidus]